MGGLFSCCFLLDALEFLAYPKTAGETQHVDEVVLMVSLLNAISIASVFAASAALRFRLWKQPFTLLFYFLSVLSYLVYLFFIK